MSRLPISVLYALSDALFVVLYRWSGYRTGVVMENLRNSFPERSAAEIKAIAEQFYRHLCDLMIESVAMMNMTREEAIARGRVVNPELLDPYAAAGQNVILVSGHYNNWELIALSFHPQVPHTAIGFYTQLTDPFMERKMRDSRGRFGTVLLTTRQVKQSFVDFAGQLSMPMFGADQSPSNLHNVHWMTFLHQDTPVALGAERYAREYGYPVVFLKTTKVKRGFYEMELLLLEENPRDTAPGQITEQHTRTLEAIIREQPAYWLWTHRRWKRKRGDLEKA